MDCQGPPPYCIPHFQVKLENRKGWQKKLGHDGPLEGVLPPIWSDLKHLRETLNSIPFLVQAIRTRFMNKRIRRRSICIDIFPPGSRSWKSLSNVHWSRQRSSSLTSVRMGSYTPRRR